jgi:hypothetical protein
MTYQDLPTSPRDLFTPELLAAGAVLRERKLQVPEHQRSYSWGAESADDRDQVEEFWEDLDSARSLTDRGYFLGTVVLSRSGASDGRLAIIDGQQRLATTSVLLAAIRSQLEILGEQGRISLVDPCISSFDARAEENVPQLILNAEDDGFYRKLIVNRENPTVDVDGIRGHVALRAAYDFFMAKLHEQMTSAEESKQILDSWFSLVTERAALMVVEVPSEADAYLIFETLNDRGADLTIADLLKNYLFGLAGDQLHTVQDSWATALSNLDVSTSGSELFTDFLRHYWSSKHGPTRERELYARIKERVTTKANAVDIADEMKVASNLYAALLSADHDFWDGYDTTTKRNVRVLGRIPIEQNRSTLLAALQFFDRPSLEDLLKKFVSVGVRGLIVGGIGGGTAEKAYCGAAQKIRSGSASSWSDVKPTVAPILHSDTAFENAFASARVSRGPFARYVLAALELGQRGEAEPELVPNDDEAEVNLEHVLPRSLNVVDWPAFNKESHGRFLHRIGNMCLLRKSENHKIGNKPYTTKKLILANSSLELTNSIAANADWTSIEIETRQKELAAIAVQVWKEV